MASRAKAGAKDRHENQDDDSVVIVKEIAQKKDAKVKEVKPSTSKGTGKAPRYELRSRETKEEVVSEVDVLAVEFTKKAVVEAQVNAEVKAKRRFNIGIRLTGAEKEEPEGATGVKAEPRYELRSSDAKKEEEHKASAGKAGVKSVLVQEPENKKDRNLRSKPLEAADSRPLGPSARNKK